MLFMDFVNGFKIGCKMAACPTVEEFIEYLSKDRKLMIVFEENTKVALYSNTVVGHALRKIYEDTFYSVDNAKLILNAAKLRSIGRNATLMGV